MTLEDMAREAGLINDAHNAASDNIRMYREALTRFAALVRAQAEAEAAERLSIIADELIAGLGEPGRGLAEMIREGVVWLESYAADVVWKVRRQALENAAKVCKERKTYWQRDDSRVYEDECCAAAIRALKDKPCQIAPRSPTILVGGNAG